MRAFAFSGLAASLILTLSFSSLAAPGERAGDRLVPYGGVHADGPEVPFPLSEQVPFPWGSIAGTWEIHDESSYARYSFELQTECGGQRALRILHLDPTTSDVLAMGSGLSNYDMSVRGVMRETAERGRSGLYILLVRAFLDNGRLEMVLTKRSLGDPERDVSHSVLRKISDSPYRPANSAANEDARRGCEERAL